MITAAEAQELRKLINILIDATEEKGYTKCAQWYGNDNEYDARREAFAEAKHTVFEWIELLTDTEHTTASEEAE
jgi:hypothetical protein